LHSGYAFGEKSRMGESSIVPQKEGRHTCCCCCCCCCWAGAVAVPQPFITVPQPFIFLFPHNGTQTRPSKSSNKRDFSKNTPWFQTRQSQMKGKAPKRSNRGEYVDTIRTTWQRKLLHNWLIKVIVKPMCSNFRTKTYRILKILVKTASCKQRSRDGQLLTK